MIGFESREDTVELPPLRDARPLSQMSAPGHLLPTTVLGWLPFWWSRILFPGRPDSTTAASRLHLCLLLILPGLLLYPCLSFHLFEPDEGRYAQIPSEMLARGDWVVPTLQGEPYLDKPPLFYWCVMLSFAVFGCHDWAARLIAALLTHATILVSYALGRRLLGPRPAFWGSLILSLAPAFLGVSRLLLLDGMLTLFATVAALSAYIALREPRLQRGWWYLAALACALAALTKGPVALVLLVPPLWLVRRLEPAPCHLPWRHVAGFAAVVLAVNLPWYVAIALRAPGFGWHFFVQHNVQRFADPFDHERPFWFFGPIVLLGLLPGTLLLLGAVRFLFSAAADAARRRAPALGYLLLAGLWCFFFFSLSGCKLPTYILPALPPLALALGTYVASSRWRASRWTFAVTAAWTVLLLVAHWRVLPEIAAARSPMGRSAEVTRWCGDPETAVYCFPRPVDSVAFYLGRSDLEVIGSKEVARLIEKLDSHSRAVILFGHRSSPALLRAHLPSHLRITEEAPLGLCRMAKIERR
jgi:4-amino-4-deoxy-L-arabinose transferase-like glycosyltransferase